MGSTPYDRSLLAQAPAATRAQLQEGYDSVLLAPKRRPKGVESDSALDSKEVRGLGQRHNAAPAISPRSRRWKPILALLITVVIIAAILGAALGTTVHRRAHTASADQDGDTVVHVGSATATTVSSSSISSDATPGGPSASPFVESVAAFATPSTAVSELFPQVSLRHFVTARRLR